MNAWLVLIPISMSLLLLVIFYQEYSSVKKDVAELQARFTSLDYLENLIRRRIESLEREINEQFNEKVDVGGLPKVPSTRGREVQPRKIRRIS